VVKPIEEGDKVKAEILTILYKEQIKFIKAEKLWPEGFEDSVVSDDLSKLKINETDIDSEENSDDESDIFKNTNRPIQQESESSSDDSEDEDENK